MPLTPPAIIRPTSVCINPFSVESLENTWRISTNGGASAAWFSANAAVFFPFYVSEPWTARKMFVVNGATASGNLDLGIYDAAGNRLVSSGSTAQSGTSDLQLVDITDTVLQPRTLYYAALAMDGTTGTTLRFGATVNGKAMGLHQMASAFALPATATFATTTTMVPFFGITTLATI